MGVVLAKFIVSDKNRTNRATLPGHGPCNANYFPLEKVHFPKVQPVRDEDRQPDRWPEAPVSLDPRKGSGHVYNSSGYKQINNLSRHSMCQPGDNRNSKRKTPFAN